METLATLDIPSPSSIKPFTIKQLLGGLERGDNDESFLSYLDFLSTQIPIKAAYFLHVTPRMEMISRLFRQEESEPLVRQTIIKERIITEMGGVISRFLPSQNIPNIKYDVRQGSALEELLVDATELKATLLAIGQKSTTDSHGILAKNLARKGSVNTLIVPDRSAHLLRRIMVPIDFSLHSAQALQTAIAIRMQSAEPVEIVCVHVYEMPDFAAFNISKTEEQLHEMVIKDRQEAFTAFVEATVPKDALPLEQALIEKGFHGVGQYLWDYAADHDIDFIIMGAKGHSKIESLFLGSATERLVTVNNSIPTLIVR